MMVLARRLCAGAQRSTRGHVADSRVMWPRPLRTKTGTCLLSEVEEEEEPSAFRLSRLRISNQILKRDRVSYN